MSETTPETEPVDAEAAYQDPRSVPLSEAWKLINPAPPPPDRMAAIKAGLHDAALAVIAMPCTPRLGDRPLLLPWGLVRRALEHPTVDLALPADELVTGNPSRGGLHFIMCRAIRAAHLASVQPAPSENEPVTIEGLAQWFAGLSTLSERWDAAFDKVHVESVIETPPVTEDRLREVLVDIFVEDEALEKADPEHLYYIIVNRDPSFRHHDGPPKKGRWGQNTTIQIIRKYKVEAKADAAKRRLGIP